MLEYRTGVEKPTFTLGFAHYHGPWEWRLVQKELAAHGFDSISPDLPVGDSDATLDDFAAIIRAAELAKGAEGYKRVGHSWSGDLIYRELGALPFMSDARAPLPASHSSVKPETTAIRADAAPITGLIFIASRLHPIIRSRGTGKVKLPADPRSVAYRSVLKAEERGESIFDPEIIAYSFYNQLKDKARRDWAIRQLRPHPHVEAIGRAELPDLPMHYIVCGNDHALSPLAQSATAVALGIGYSVLERADHVPMLSQPKKLAAELIRIANQQDSPALPV